MKMKTLFMTCLLVFTAGLNAQMVKNFTLKNLSNEQKSFNDLKGEKLTLIDFWATWCKPCNKAIPELNKIYSRYKDRGVEIIGINCDGPRSISKVAPMVKSLQIQYPVLIDINAGLMDDLNLMAYPTLLMVNGEGKILWIHEGYVTGDGEVISAEIEKNLNAI